MNYPGFISDLEEIEKARLKMLEHYFRYGGSWNLKIRWNQLYPEYFLPRYATGVDRTYWRRGTKEEFIPPNKYYLERVIVYINPSYNREDFKKFYGEDPVDFAKTIVYSQIIPVIAEPNAYAHVEWGKDFFTILYDHGLIPAYARRLEDLLIAEQSNTDVELGRFSELVKKRKQQYKVPENVKSEWLKVMRMHPAEYLTERTIWMELLGWDDYRELLDPNSSLLEKPELAQNYAFSINYFTNVRNIYAKGGCVTLIPEDLPSMVSTMKGVMSYFRPNQAIYSKLNGIANFSSSIFGRFKKLLCKPIYKGNKVENIREFSEVSKKEEFQNERNELFNKKEGVFQKREEGILKSERKDDINAIKDSDDDISQKLDELQEMLDNIGKIMKIKVNVRNAAVTMGSYAVLLSSLSLPSWLQQVPTLPLSIACLVDVYSYLNYFNKFKLKYNVDCLPMIVYMQNKDAAKKAYKKMIEIGAIRREEGSNALSMMDTCYGDR